MYLTKLTCISSTGLMWTQTCVLSCTYGTIRTGVTGSMDAEHYASCMTPYLLQYSGEGWYVPQNAAVPDGSQRH